MNNDHSIEKIAISTLKPAEYNPREIDDDEYENLKKSIAEFGLVEPFVVNADNTVIGGHQRLKAVIDLGYTEVEVVRVDLPKNKEKILNIALNKISGRFVQSKLDALLIELEDLPEFEITGFEKLDVLEAKDRDEVEEKDETGGGLGNPIISYNIIFDNDQQQDKWFAFIKKLKDEYPDAVTLGERLELYINYTLG